jgi:6-phosphogluconolactonase
MGYRRSWWNGVCVLAVMAQLCGFTTSISQAQTSNTAAARFAFGSIYGPAGRSGIYTYTMDPATAQLRLADYLEISSLGGATDILGVEPKGKFTYTFVTNPQTGSFEIMGAQISQTNGSVTPIPGSPFPCACFSGSTSSYGSTANVLAFDPTGSFLYVLSGTGSVANGILAFAINSTTGALSLVSNSPFATGNGASAIVIDPTGKFLYATNLVDGTISAFTRSTSTGALTEVHGSPFPFAPGSPGLIAIDPKAPFLYVSQFSTGFATSGNIVGYSMNTSTGALTALSNPTAVSDLGSMLIDPAGKFLYIESVTKLFRFA